MSKSIAILAAAFAISLAAPAMAASQAECEAHWSKIDSKKAGYVMRENAKNHMDRMAKAGKKTAAADRISDKEFIDSLDYPNHSSVCHKSLI